MTKNAHELAEGIKLGWNIGNTMEAIGGETAWGNPKISDELLQLIKQSGFDAVRLPVSWNQYADATSAKISSDWLARVKEVVQLCVNNDLYVVLNIHWDGGWLEENINDSVKEAVNAKQKAFWEQIATELRDFDEHLLFASANEPHADDSAEMSVLLSYHQTFVDSVRATGGKNAYRVLIVQGPHTDIEKTNQLMLQMPTDAISSRLMAEVHFYSPYQFTLMKADESWGNQFYFWGAANHSSTDTDHNPNWGEEDYITSQFQLMKAQFVDNGYPVILGEFGAMRRTGQLSGDDLVLHLKSRAFWHKYVTEKALANGLMPFYWDTGGLDDYSFGVFDRAKNSVYYQQTLDALLQGAGKK